MPEPRNWWVVCDDYTMGPYTRERAERWATRPMECQLPHRAEQHDRPPVPVWRARLEEGEETDG